MTHDTSRPPPGGKLYEGDQVTVTLGKRRIVHAEDTLYFNRENRRYYGRVLDAWDVPHTTRHGERCKRRRCHVQILEAV